MPRKFVRPKNWYRPTVESLVLDALPPLLGAVTRETAWRYVYAVVMWKQTHDGVGYLHLQESDKLGRASGREFANRAAEYLKEHLCLSPCDPFDVVDQIGKADTIERAKQNFGPAPRRDANVTGAAFETVIQVLINELSGVLPYRTPTLNTLQGFELAPVGYHSKPDLALFGPRDFRLLVSTKWTLRKERIGTYLHEAYFYKQRRPDLQVAFVLSEYNMNILNWLSQDPLVDRVYHVNKRMLLHLNDPLRAIPADELVPRNVLQSSDYRRWLNVSERVFDLSDLFADIETLSSNQDESPDPDVDEEPSEDDV